ncbi:zinc ribbon domain-containing protein [Dehalococcoidia bacterium]|nr:zinc ribbon domain-containing protein [Dehalococcoidia bacterium]
MGEGNCQKCGMQLSEGTKFCTSCGQIVDPVFLAEEITETPSGSRRGLMGIGLFLGVLLVTHFLLRIFFGIEISASASIFVSFVALWLWRRGGLWGGRW